MSMQDKNNGSILGIIFFIMMTAISLIMVYNALYGLGSVVQDIPAEYKRIFAEDKIFDIKVGVLILFFASLLGWISELRAKMKK